MIPESDFIEETITVRDMRLPTDVTLTKRSLIRWIALSLGLINPNESRKSLIYLIEILFENQLKKHEGISVEQIMENVSKMKDVEKRFSEKTVRYHLLRLEKKGFVKRKNIYYSLSVSDFSDDSIENMIESYIVRQNKAMDKVKIALNKLKGLY
jgi:repressor of nif and glnA expression